MCGFFRGFFPIQNHVILSGDSFVSSFLLSMLCTFFLLLFLIALARTSSTMLNRSGESGHPCLVLDLRGKASSLRPLNMLLVVGVSNVAFILLRKFSSIPTSLMCRFSSFS